jgi:hypothetical protein
VPYSIVMDREEKNGVRRTVLAEIATPTCGALSASYRCVFEENSGGGAAPHCGDGARPAGNEKER